MSQDPTRSALAGALPAEEERVSTNVDRAAPRADAPSDPTATEPTRRTFLQYAGIGLATAAVPTISGCAVDAAPTANVPAGEQALTTAEQEALVAAAAWFDVRRRDDLIAFRLGVVNLLLTSTSRSGQPPGVTLNGTWYFTRGTTAQAYVILEFQPQSIFEQAYEENPAPGEPAGLPNGGTTPVDAVMGKTSQLVFMVPSNVNAIAYELDQILLAVQDWPLSVAGNATPGPAPIILRPGPIVLQKQARAVVTELRARSRANLFAKMNPGAELPASLRPSTEALIPSPVPIPNPIPIPIPLPFVYTIPVQPGALATQLELPFRLTISPNQYAQWQHSTTAEVNGKAKRVELWTTRMTTPQGWQKTIRALWTRDSTFDATNPVPAYNAINAQTPFLGSLRDGDRGSIVHRTTNFTCAGVAPVATDALMLSTLGGWLDAHGTWPDPVGKVPGLVAWDHVATMGRDHYVRAVQFGYLYPYGHKAVFVEVAERKFKDGYASTAYVWRRQYVIVKEPLKTYDSLAPNLARGFPFTSVRFKTLITPDILPFDNSTPIGVPGMAMAGWIAIPSGSGDAAFQFKVEAFDHAGNVQHFTTPCMFVSHDDLIASYSARGNVDARWTAANDPTFTETSARRSIDMHSQRVAYAQPTKPDDTRYATTSLLPRAWWPAALNESQPFVPQLDWAYLDIDTIRGITGSSQPQPFSYHKSFVDNGFDGNLNKGEVVLGYGAQDPNVQIPGAAKPTLDVSKMTHKSGGFVAPNLDVGGLSRKQGILGGDPGSFASGQGFDPGQFFNNIGANLFGCVPISGIIDAIDPDLFKQTPKWLTQGLQTIETIVQMATDLASSDNTADTIASELTNVLNELVVAINAAIANAPPDANAHPMAAALYPIVQAKAAKLAANAAAIQSKLNDFLNQANQLITLVTDATTGIVKLCTDVASTLQAIMSNPDPVSQVQPFVTAIGALNTGLANVSAKFGDTTAFSLPLDAGVRSKIVGAANAFTKAYTALGGDSGVTALATTFANAEDAIENLHIKLDWSPKMTSFPASFPIFVPNDPHGFHVGVEIRGKAQDGMDAGADVYASLCNFQINLLGSDPFIILKFEKLIFKAGSNSKPDIDCVFDGVQFAGPLSFIETLKKFLPLDGFSDPPNVQVTTEGLTAQFGIPLPNIACGMFSLENLSFNAGFTIPFIGKSLEVNFSFCTRESPFVLTVCMLGGGGFVGITISPKEVVKLEISLEATACLAVDFGVASGSISISVGIYLCIESGDCKLSGFVKFHGDVNILEIVQASLDLDLELSYESATGKVIGEASLEIHVSILCFGFTVSVHVQKKFKGGNNDPTFRTIMQLNPADANFPNPWADYVQAFQPIAVPATYP